MEIQCECLIDVLLVDTDRKKSFWTTAAFIRKHSTTIYVHFISYHFGWDVWDASQNEVSFWQPKLTPDVCEVTIGVRSLSFPEKDWAETQAKPAEQRGWLLEGSCSQSVGHTWASWIRGQKFKHHVESSFISYLCFSQQKDQMSHLFTCLREGVSLFTQLHFFKPWGRILIGLT